MSESVIDFAGLDATASAVTDSGSTEDTSSSTETSTQETNVETNETAEIDAESTDDSSEGKETQTHNADGTEKTAEEQEAFKKAAAAQKVPASIAEQRAALKALKDLDPKYAKVVKDLHGAAERWNAAKELLGVGQGNGVVGLKNFMQEVGAKTLPELREAYQQNASVQTMVKETDELLYEASPELTTNVYDDMKANGAEGNYPKVVGNFLRHLKEVDAAGYYDIAQGSALEAMDEAGFATAANRAFAQLNAGDVAGAKKTLQAVGKWYTDLRDSQSEKSKAKSETQKLEDAKKSWESEKGATERKAAETSVATEAETSNNATLGKELAPILKLPFFKEFSRQNLEPLGREIKTALYAELKSSKEYQRQVGAMFKAKTLDKAAILRYHNETVKQIAPRLVRDTVARIYPGAWKGGTAAGRVAAAAVKKEAATKVSTQSSATAPVYVASRPTNLIREEVTVNGRTYSPSELQVMQIAGRGIVRTADQKGFRFVSWRKPSGK